jgi:hypothetical protein
MVFDLESIIFVIIGNLVVLDHSSIAFFKDKLSSFVGIVLFVLKFVLFILVKIIINKYNKSENYSF